MSGFYDEFGKFHPYVTITYAATKEVGEPKDRPKRTEYPESYFCTMGCQDPRIVEARSYEEAALEYANLMAVGFPFTARVSDVLHNTQSFNITLKSSYQATKVEEK